MDDEDLRLAVYRGLAATGRAPSRDDLVDLLGVDRAGVDDGLRRLAALRHLALDAAGGIVLAHPFATVNLGFSVMGRDTLWWGGCAWDSFAIPHLVPTEPDVLVATTCPHCGAALAWVVGREGPPDGDAVADFPTSVHHIWDDVVRTCSRQRLFCSRDHLDAWHRHHPVGDVLDLATLWRLAQHWYDGRLDRGYARRDPSEAAAYFRSVGLDGPHWGLEDVGDGGR